MQRWAEESLREAIDLLARSARNDLASDLNRILGRVDFDDLDILRCEGSDELADGILQAGSFVELVDLLGQIADTFAVRHVTLHVIREGSLSNFTTKILTTYPQAWVARYVNRRYFLLDPVGFACQSADHGFFWDVLDRRAPILRGFWDDAAAHEVGPSGYTLPILTEQGDRLAISICSSEDAGAFRDRIERYEGDLFNLGVFLADAFCRLATVDRPTKFNPSDDQLAILRAIAVGSDEEELAQRSYQYGSFSTLRRSICDLFRTRTLAQAAVLATRIGLLAETPLTVADVLTANDRQQLKVQAGATALRRLARLRNPATPGGLPDGLDEAT